MAKQKKGSKPKASESQTAAVSPEMDNAAAAAAAFISHAGRGAGKTAEPARAAESASFKHLKETIAQPGGAGVSNLLDRSAPPGQQKSHLPLAGPGSNQKGHNQTIGSDASRTGVPRRTGG